MPANSPIIAVNGALDATISPLDRGFAYGDGLFETCRVRGGDIALWPLHRSRLTRDAERLGIPLIRDELESQRRQILTSATNAGHQEGVLKLIVTRGQGGRGYAPPDDPDPTLCWLFFPGVKADWEENARRGIQLRVCRQRLQDNPLLAGLKHLNRLEYVLARSEWGSEYPEGLLLDGRDRVIEGTVSNLFVWIDGQLCTPPLERAGVAGVMRRFIRDQLAPGLGMTVLERNLELADLARARELFVCNSVFGIWPVTRLAPDGCDYPIGPVTLQLQSARQTFFDSPGNSEGTL